VTLTLFIVGLLLLVADAEALVAVGMHAVRETSPGG